MDGFLMGSERARNMIPTCVYIVFTLHDNPGK